MAKKKKVTQEEPQEVILGVSLARFAAVNAAVAEGISLPEVLEIEGLDARSYPKADTQWKQRLVAAATLSAGLFDAYQKELADAEDWLTRAVTPLDTNPMAWAAFLQAYSASTDPGAWLKSLKLGPNDVSRLTRAWEKRVEKDPALSKQLGEFAKSSTGAVPPLSVGPIARKRSKAAPAEEAPKPVAPAASTSTPDAAHEDIGLDRWAALQADLAAFPDVRDRVLAKYGLLDPAAFEAVRQRWTAALQGDPALNRDYRTLFSHFANQARFEGPPSATQAPAQAPPPPEDDGRLVFAPSPAVVEAPAFRGVSAPPAQPIEAAALAPAETKAPPGATMDVASLLATATAAALPFREGPAALPIEPEEDKPAPQATGTQDVSALLSAGMALPFGGRPPAPPAQPEKAPEAPAPKAAGTQDVSALLSAGVALPFGGRPTVLPVEPEKPREAPVHKASGTQDVSALLESGAPTPFEPVKPMRPSPSRPEIPNLSLEQYASLCVELHLAPERADEIFGRYGVPKDVRGSVDAYWQRRLGAEPALYQAYVQAYNSYRAWLAQNRRR